MSGSSVEAYKLLRLRKDGTLGPLFINRRQIISEGKWLSAECHPTSGYAVRPGWHVVLSPVAPHLTKKGRVWCKVQVQDYTEIKRPKSQGGVWLLANKMLVVERMPEVQ